MTQAETTLDKIWQSHVVTQEPDIPAVLYIDLHLIHEVTSPQAFQGLRDRGLKVRRPSQTIATMDHGIPTTPLDVPIQDKIAARQMATLEKNAGDFGIRLFGMNSPNRGIVHIIGPELGLTQPGMTIQLSKAAPITASRSMSSCSCSSVNWRSWGASARQFLCEASTGPP